MVCSRTMFLNTLCYEIDTKTWCYSRASCSWYFVHSDFVCKNLIAVCRFAYFSRFANIFLCYFFSKGGFKWSLNKRKPLKLNVIKWKTKHLQPAWCSNFRKYLWTFIWHPTFFAVKESCHDNLLIDCWLSNKWNNFRPVLVESSVIVIFTWSFSTLCGKY